MPVVGCRPSDGGRLLKVVKSRRGESNLTARNKGRCEWVAVAAAVVSTQGFPGRPATECRYRPPERTLHNWRCKTALRPLADAADVAGHYAKCRLEEQATCVKWQKGCFKVVQDEIDLCYGSGVAQLVV